MKRIITIGLVVAGAMILLSSCNCYRKMSKKVDGVEATCSPKLLALKGNSVPADITVTFPAKYFKENAVLKITPVLVFEGGEIAGTPKFVQGEKVKDNFTVIPWKTGGSYTQSVVFPYDERANISTLVLRIEAKCSDNCSAKYNEYLPLGADKAIARGVSTLQNDIVGDNIAIMPDNFKRVTTISEEAQIMYQISQSKVRPAELTTEQVKLLEAFVKENSTKDRTELGSIYSNGYASPDGPVALNDKLSSARGEAGKAAISQKLKDVKGAKYDVAAYGEDWDGFKQLVEQSDMKDKALILQVLSMYDDPVRRDKEIHNMSSAFNVLAKEILPQLRRTKLVATADVTGKTDAEIAAAAKSNLSSLSLEEVLYAAAMTNNNDEKINLYSYAAKQYNDARAYNNLGAVLLLEGKAAEAKQALNKAASLTSDPAISNNLGAVAVAQNNVAEAKKYLSSLNTPEAKANLGLAELKEGNYAAAQKNLKGYDLAVTEVLNGNLNQAKSAIAADQSAAADYLRGVISSREGDTKAAIANLKSAFAKDPSLKVKAQKDIEFASLFNLPEFKAL